MSKKLLYLLLITLAILQTAKAQDIGNLVQNPSFEEDEVILDDPAWEAWATWGWEGGLNSTVVIDDTEFVDGETMIVLLYICVFWIPPDEFVDHKLIPPYLFLVPSFSLMLYRSTLFLYSRAFIY
jgi:hypothetical protein